MGGGKNYGAPPPPPPFMGEIFFGAFLGPVFLAPFELIQTAFSPQKGGEKKPLFWVWVSPCFPGGGWGGGGGGRAKSKKNPGGCRPPPPRSWAKKFEWGKPGFYRFFSRKTNLTKAGPKVSPGSPHRESRSPNCRIPGGVFLTTNFLVFPQNSPLIAPQFF